jgi:hypothetical protein
MEVAEVIPMKMHRNPSSLLGKLLRIDVNAAIPITPTLLISD